MDQSMKAKGKQIKAAYETLSKAYEFKPGDLVEWKPGMNDARRLPDYGEPVVVVEVIPGNISPCIEEGHRRYRSRVDLAVGIMEDGEFQIYHFDSRRFRPSEGGQ